MGCGASRENKDENNNNNSKVVDLNNNSIEAKKASESNQIPTTNKEIDISKLKKIRALYDYQKKTENGINLQRGEVVCVIDDSDADWWIVIKPETREQGAVPSNFVEPFTDNGNEENIESLEFYFPGIQRGECEQMLSLCETNGAFMIRPSNQAKAPHTLSVLDANRQIKHYRIIFEPGQGFYIGENNIFPNLTELVKYYRTGRDSKIIQLRMPVPRSGPSSGLGKDIWEVDREKIQLLSRLGQGFYGEVWKGIYDKNTIVAVKTFKEGKMDPQDFLNEATIMKSVKHKRLVQLLAVCTVGIPLYIICEFMDNGCLKDYLVSRKGTITVGVLISMCTQVCEGMEYLESVPIVHRDLAARNILISKNCECKIADFGMALLHNDRVQIGNINTHFPIKWTAPEAFEQKKFSNKSDIWSYAVLMWEILTFCENPYSGKNNKEVFQYVLAGNVLGKPDTCSSSLYDHMKRCWAKNPDDRPSFKELLPDLQKEEKLAVEKGGLYNEL